MKNKFHRLLIVAGLFSVAAIPFQFAAASLIWDSGAPHPYNVNSVENYSGYSCGNLSSTLSQDWVASPFAVVNGSTNLTQINVDWSDTGGSNGGGTSVSYQI